MSNAYRFSPLDSITLQLFYNLFEGWDRTEAHSTVTLFAKLRGWSASFPMKTAVW